MMDLYKLTMPKLNELKEQLNLTEDELIVFDMLSKRKTITEISERLRLSSRTVDNRIRDIKNKMAQL